MAAEIDRRLALQAAGTMLPFLVEEQATGRALGMTTFMNIDSPNRRLEIGSTWYRKSIQRTGVNTECKQLLLSHAFDTLGCIAVELRTSSFNRASRAAIERLGAKLDGVLRSHQIVEGDVLRDTYVYSIVATEWPAVKKHLAHSTRRKT
jgi:RimJ/RimL family protein N-acetyltransferase